MKFRQEENRIWILALRAVLVTLLVVILLVVLKRNGIVARGQDVPVSVRGGNHGTVRQRGAGYSIIKVENEQRRR